VRNSTAWIKSACNDWCVSHKRKAVDNTTAVSVARELGKPRMARSARIAELKLDPTRIPEPPSTTLPGTVDKIIPSSGSSQPEKAQIDIQGADRGYRNLRIENSLTDEHGDDVKLKKGAHVEVTFMVAPKA
jgi:hypothetical protein